MLLKALLIKLSYGFLTVAIILVMVKIIMYSKYRLGNKDNLSLQLSWYKQMDIYSTSSANKRKFMQQMNFVTTVMFISVLIFIVVTIARRLVD